MDGLLFLIITMLVFAFTTLIISIAAKKIMLAGIALALLLAVPALLAWG